MSITPARPTLHTGHTAGVSSSAEAEAPTRGESHATSERLSTVNHLEQRQRVHGAKWFGANQRAMPQVTLGMRDGNLVPPRGAIVNRSSTAATRALALKNAAARGAKGPGRASQSAAHGEGVEEEEEGEGLLSQTLFGDGAATAPARFGQGLGADAGGGEDGAPMGLAEFLKARDAADARAAGLAQAADSASSRSTPAPGTGHPDGKRLRADVGGLTSETTETALTAQQALLQMRGGDVCWTTSLRLAMQCAQMHPGGDIFVQAFNVADGEGHVIPAFSKRMRLRADASGTVLAQALHGGGAQGAAPPTTDSQVLLNELQDAALLGLSLTEAVNESGQPISGLSHLRPSEWDDLRRLFARPLPVPLRSALVNAVAGLVATKALIFERPDLAERMADHGDALERALQLQRVSPSKTISGGDSTADRADRSAADRSAAYRAQANWQHAQAQVTHWAQHGQLPTFERVLQINAMLGEGMKPWNRAEQADRAGARFGVLRHFDVVAGVPPMYFVRADQVLLAMQDLFDWLDSQARAPEAIFTAAQVHQRLVSIHPFADANGRTARLVLDWLLQLRGWPPALLAATELALFAHADPAGAQNPNPGAAESAVVEGLQRSLREHLSRLQIDESRG
jgi:Fic/DOC family